MDVRQLHLAFVSMSWNFRTSVRDKGVGHLWLYLRLGNYFNLNLFFIAEYIRFTSIIIVISQMLAISSYSVCLRNTIKIIIYIVGLKGLISWNNDTQRLVE